MTPPRSSMVQGALLALAAAVAFGVTTPAVRHFGAGVGPLATASVLYAGATAAALASPSSPSPERPLRPRPSRGASNAPTQRAGRFS